MGVPGLIGESFGWEGKSLFIVLNTAADGTKEPGAASVTSETNLCVPGPSEKERT